MVRCCFCCYCCCCRRCWRLRGVYHVSSSPRSQSRATSTTTTPTATTRQGGGWTSRISGLWRSFHSQPSPETTQLSTFGTKPIGKSASKTSALGSPKDPKVPSDFPAQASATSTDPPPIEVSHASHAGCAQGTAQSLQEASWTPHPHCTHLGKGPHCVLESDPHKLCKECIQADILEKPSPIHCSHVHCPRHVHRPPVSPHSCELYHSFSSSCVEAHVCKHYQFHRCVESEGAEVVHYRHHRRASQPVTFAETSQALFNCQHKIAFVEKGFPPCDRSNDLEGDESLRKEAAETLGAKGAKKSDSVPGAEVDDTQSQSVPSTSTPQATEVGGQPTIKTRISERNVKIYQSLTKKCQKIFYRWSSTPDGTTKAEVQQEKSQNKQEKSQTKQEKSQTKQDKSQTKQDKSQNKQDKSQNKEDKSQNIKSKSRSASKHSIFSFLESKKKGDTDDDDDDDQQKSECSSVSEISSSNLSTGHSSNLRELRKNYEHLLSTTDTLYFGSEQDLDIDETSKVDIKGSDNVEADQISTISQTSSHPVSSSVESTSEESGDHSPSHSGSASVDSYSYEAISTNEEEEETVHSVIDVKEKRPEETESVDGDKSSIESDSKTEKISESKERSYSLSSFFGINRKRNATNDKSLSVDEKHTSYDTDSGSSTDTDIKVERIEPISECDDSVTERDDIQDEAELAERRHSVASTASEGKGAQRVNRIVTSTVGQWKRIQGSLGSITTNIKNRYQQKASKKHSKEGDSIDIGGSDDVEGLKEEDSESNGASPEDKKLSSSEGEEGISLWDESVGRPSPDICDLKDIILEYGKSLDRSISPFDIGLLEDNQSIKDISSSIISDVVSPLSVSECIGEISSASNSSGTTSSEGGDTSIQSFLSVIARVPTEIRADETVSTGQTKVVVEDENLDEKPKRDKLTLAGINSHVISDHESRMDPSTSDVTLFPSGDKTPEVEKELPAFVRSRNDRASRSLRWRKGSKKMPKVCRDSQDLEGEPLPKRPSLDVAPITEEKDLAFSRKGESSSKKVQPTLDNTRKRFCEGMLESEGATSAVSISKVSRDSLPCDNNNFKDERPIPSALPLNTHQMKLDDAKKPDDRKQGGRRDYTYSHKRDDTVDVSDDIFDSDDVDTPVEDTSIRDKFSKCVSEDSATSASTCEFVDVHKDEADAKDKVDSQETLCVQISEVDAPENVDSQEKFRAQKNEVDEKEKVDFQEKFRAQKHEVASKDKVDIKETFCVKKSSVDKKDKVDFHSDMQSVSDKKGVLQPLLQNKKESKSDAQDLKKSVQGIGSGAQSLGRGAEEQGKHRKASFKGRLRSMKRVQEVSKDVEQPFQKDEQRVDDVPELTDVQKLKKVQESCKGVQELGKQLNDNVQEMEGVHKLGGNVQKFDGKFKGDVQELKKDTQISKASEDTHVPYKRLKEDMGTEHGFFQEKASSEMQIEQREAVTLDKGNIVSGVTECSETSSQKVSKDRRDADKVPDPMALTRKRRQSMKKRQMSVDFDPKRSMSESDCAHKLPEEVEEVAHKLPEEVKEVAHKLPKKEEEGTHKLPEEEGKGAHKLPGEEKGAHKLPEEEKGAHKLPGEEKSAHKLPEEEKGAHKLPGEEKGAHKLPGEEKSAHKLPEEEKGAHKLPEEEKGAHKLPEEEGKGAHKLPGEEKGAHKLPGEEKSAHKLPEEEKGAHKLPEEEKGAHKLPEEEKGAHKLPEEEKGAHKLPGEEKGAHKLPEVEAKSAHKLPEEEKKDAHKLPKEEEEGAHKLLANRSQTLPEEGAHKLLADRSHTLPEEVAHKLPEVEEETMEVGDVGKRVEEQERMEVGDEGKSMEEADEGERMEVAEEEGALVSASAGGVKIVVTGAMAESPGQSPPPPTIVLESGSHGSGDGSLAEGLAQSQDNAQTQHTSSSNLGSDLGPNPHRPPTPKSPITVDEWVAALPHPTSIDEDGDTWSGCDQGSEDPAEDLLGLGDEAGLMTGSGRGSASTSSLVGGASSSCTRDLSTNCGTGTERAESGNVSDSRDQVGDLPLASPQHHGAGQPPSPSHGNRPVTLSDVEGTIQRPFQPSSPGGLESRRSQFANIKHSSFQSDLSGLSLHSRSSIDSLLDSRQADPVDVLLSLGFGGKPQEGGVSRIPDRFLRPSQVRGNSIDEFLKSEDEFSDMMESAEWMPGLDPQGDAPESERPQGMVVAGTALSPRGRRYRRHRLRPSSPQPSIRSAPASFQYPKSRYLSVHREGHVTPYHSVWETLRRSSVATVSPLMSQILDNIRENRTRFLQAREDSLRRPSVKPPLTGASRFASIAKNVGTKSAIMKSLANNNKLSVLNPENRRLLDLQGQKSPEVPRKRLIIGQSSFDLGRDGELIVNTDAANGEGFNDEDSLATENSPDEDSSDDDDDNSLDKAVLRRILHHPPLQHKESVWSMASSVTSIDSNEEELRDQRRNLTLSLNRRATPPDSPATPSTPGDSLDSPLSLCTAGEEAEKRRKLIRRLSQNKRMSTVSSGGSWDEKIPEELEEESFHDVQEQISENDVSSPFSSCNDFMPNLSEDKMASALTDGGESSLVKKLCDVHNNENWYSTDRVPLLDPLLNFTNLLTDTNLHRPDACKSCGHLTHSLSESGRTIPVSEEMSRSRGSQRSFSQQRSNGNLRRQENVDDASAQISTLSPSLLQIPCHQSTPNTADQDDASKSGNVGPLLRSGSAQSDSSGFLEGDVADGESRNVSSSQVANMSIPSTAHTWWWSRESAGSIDTVRHIPIGRSCANRSSQGSRNHSFDHQSSCLQQSNCSCCRHSPQLYRPCENSFWNQPNESSLSNNMNCSRSSHTLTLDYPMSSDSPASSCPSHSIDRQPASDICHSNSSTAALSTVGYEPQSFLSSSCTSVSCASKCLHKFTCPVTALNEKSAMCRHHLGAAALSRPRRHSLPEPLTASCAFDKAFIRPNASGSHCYAPHHRVAPFSSTSKSSLQSFQHTYAPQYSHSAQSIATSFLDPSEVNMSGGNHHYPSETQSLPNFPTPEDRVDDKEKSRGDLSIAIPPPLYMDRATPETVMNALKSYRSQLVQQEHLSRTLQATAAFSLSNASQFSQQLHSISAMRAAVRAEVTHMEQLLGNAKPNSFSSNCISSVMLQMVTLLRKQAELCHDIERLTLASPLSSPVPDESVSSSVHLSSQLSNNSSVMSSAANPDTSLDHTAKDMVDGSEISLCSSFPLKYELQSSGTRDPSCVEDLKSHIIEDYRLSDSEHRYLSNEAVKHERHAMECGSRPKLHESKSFQEPDQCRALDRSVMAKSLSLDLSDVRADRVKNCDNVRSKDYFGYVDDQGSDRSARPYLESRASSQEDREWITQLVEEKVKSQTDIVQTHLSQQSKEMEDIKGMLHLLLNKLN